MSSTASSVVALPPACVVLFSSMGESTLNFGVKNYTAKLVKWLHWHLM